MEPEHVIEMVEIQNVWYVMEKGRCCYKSQVMGVPLSDVAFVRGTPPATEMDKIQFVLFARGSELCG